jgi:hypothetical protein
LGTGFSSLIPAVTPKMKKTPVKKSRMTVKRGQEETVPEKTRKVMTNRPVAKHAQTGMPCSRV